eukprot:g22454.t1
MKFSGGALESCRNTQLPRFCFMLEGPDTAVLFISLRFQRIHQDYLDRRLKSLGEWRNRILLCRVDVEQPEEALEQVTLTAFHGKLSLLLAWTDAEAAAYLETLHRHQSKGAQALMGRLTQGDHEARLREGINKTDAAALAARFGSFAGVAQAQREDLLRCSGIGDKKVRQLNNVVQALTEVSMDVESDRSFEYQRVLDGRRNVYRFGRDGTILWEATGRSEVKTPTEAEAAAQVQVEDGEDLEVPGIRAIRAFFRSAESTLSSVDIDRPASAPAGTRCPQSSQVCYHMRDFTDMLAAAAGEVELLKPAVPPPPLVRPIRSPLDRRRRSLAGRRSFSRSNRPGSAQFRQAHMADAAANPVMPRKKGLPQARDRRARELLELQLCAQGHSEICEDCDAGDLGREMSPVLKSCGERIGSLSGKIFSLEDQLTLRGGDSSLAIEIIPHGQQASAATRQKEEAADRALASHARFASLEELQENLQKHASSYDDLMLGKARGSSFS